MHLETHCHIDMKVYDKENNAIDLAEIRNLGKLNHIYATDYNTVGDTMQMSVKISGDKGNILIFGNHNGTSVMALILIFSNGTSYVNNFLDKITLKSFSMVEGSGSGLLRINVKKYGSYVIISQPDIEYVKFLE